MRAEHMHNLYFSLYEHKWQDISLKIKENERREKARLFGGQGIKNWMDLMCSFKLFNFTNRHRTLD